MRPVDSGQSGQASVFILSLTGVILLCTIFLYLSGRITSEKMQLQNAADAAAYSASVLEARSLNFTAYTNRAMVANEVAVGQLVGILSWVDELKSMGEYLNAYADFIDIVTSWLYLVVGVGDVIEGFVDTITQALAAIGDVITDIGESIDEALKPLCSAIIRGLSMVNEVYSVSQTVYHGATVALVTTTIFKTLEDNVPGTHFDPLHLFNKNSSGARLSDLGIIALAGHIPSFWSGYTRRYTQEKKKEAEKETGKGEKEEVSGMARLAATIRNGRDPFSSGGPSIRERGTDFSNRAWEFGLGHQFHYDVSVLDLVEVSGDINIFLGVDSLGGSEIRYKDNAFTWSAVDTALADGELDYSAIDFSIFGFKIDIPAGKIPLKLPLGGGACQAPADEKSTLTAMDMVKPLPDRPKKARTKSYGGAGSGKSRGKAFTIAAASELEENRLNSYSGLRPYRDMTHVEVGPEKEPSVPPDNIADQVHIPFTEPYFLVGVVRDRDDITGKGPQFSGPLNLGEDNPDNPVPDKIAAIARSELYFKRPHDLRYFRRRDRMTEKPNVFSPFWQARLAETSDIDRFLALAVQQDVIWLSGQAQQEIPGLPAIVAAAQRFIGTLEKILEIF